MQAIDLLTEYIRNCHTKQLLQMRYSIILPANLEALVKIYGLQKRYRSLVYNELKERPKVYNKKESKKIRQIMSEKRVSRSRAEELFSKL